MCKKHVHAWCGVSPLCPHEDLLQVTETKVKAITKNAKLISVKTHEVKTNISDETVLQSCVI